MKNRKPFNVKALWEKLGNVPVNNDGDIEEPFLHFGVGTDREDIWHWFEDALDVSVVGLMRIKNG